MAMSYRLNHLLERSAGIDPSRTCLIEGERRTSYGELERSSTAMARWLVSHGIRPGDRVGLFLPKSAEALIAIFGILKAGAVYVPIDVASPISRASHIVRDCGVGVLVTDERRGAPLQADLASRGTGVDRVVVGPFDENSGHSHAWDDVTSWLGDDALPAGTERDLAYILYTSGSTGVPKGVMISHRAALSFVDWGHDEFDVTSDDVVSSHAPLHFDLSVFDIFVSVKAGATIVLFGEGASTFPVRLTQAIAEHGITVWYSVPTALALMIDRGRFNETDTSSLRVVLFAGEVYPTPGLRLLRAATDARLYNLFGPTETNVCTFHEVVELPEDDGETIPIGVPIPNYEILVLGEDDAPVRPGEAGELVARGPGLMSGYWGDREKTDRVLVQNPVHGRFPDPVYRTGDLVRFDDRELLRFLGRRDHQVKVRGYRIELGEIEAALHAHEAVSEAACVLRPNATGDPTIVGVVAFRAGAVVDVGVLRDHCVASVPRYMVPDAFEVLDTLPRTSTGKTDRQAIARLLESTG